MTLHRPARSPLLLSLLLAVAALAAAPRSAHAEEPPAPLAITPWYQGAAGYERATRERAATRSAMLVYFCTEWCPYCRAIAKDLFPKLQVQHFLRDVPKVRINPETGPAEEALGKRYGVRGYPTVFLLAPGSDEPLRVGAVKDKGSAESPEQSALSPAEFIQNLRQAPRQGSQSHVATASQHLVKGRLREARAELDQAARLDASNPQLHYFRGRLEEKAGAAAAAVAAYQRAIELQPDYLDAHGALAVMALNGKRFDDAVAHATQIIDRQASYDRGWAFGVRASAWLHKGDCDAAARDFQRACQLGDKESCSDASPRVAGCHLNRGVDLGNGGKVREGLVEIERAVAADPKSSEAHRLRGWLLQRAKDLPRAEQAYRQALSLKSDDAEAHLGLASTLFDQRRYDEVIAQTGKALRWAQPAQQGEAHYLRSLSYYNKQDLKSALGEAARACQLGNKESCKDQREWLAAPDGKP